MDKWLQIKICLINSLDNKGVYNPKDAEVIDYIVVSLTDLGFIFFRTLIEHIDLLLTRNGILPED